LARDVTVDARGGAAADGVPSCEFRQGGEAMASRFRRRDAAAAIVLALLVGCSGDDDDASPPASTTTTTAPAAAGEELQLGEHDAVRVELLGGPDWLAADESFLYVKRDSGAVDRIEPTTGAVVGSAELGEGGLCQGIGVGFGSVWSCDGTDVVRVDLDAGEVVSRIAAGKTAGQGHLATGFDRVWVLQGDGSTLVGIDPQTEAISDPIALPVRGSDLAVGDDGIWIVSALDDAVVVIDPADGTQLHRMDGFDEPTMLSIVDAIVWVGDSAAVHRIDQAAATIVSTFEGGIGRSGAVAADDTGVWVRRAAEVGHLDAASGSETDAFTLDLDGPSPGDMLVAFGALWTTASEDAALFRIALD